MPRHDAQLEALDRAASINVRNELRSLAKRRWFMTPMARPDLSALAAYSDRLDSRPGFRAHGRNGRP